MTGSRNGEIVEIAGKKVKQYKFFRATKNAEPGVITVKYAHFDPKIRTSYGIEGRTDDFIKYWSRAENKFDAHFLDPKKVNMSAVMGKMEEKDLVIMTQKYSKELTPTGEAGVFINAQGYKFRKLEGSIAQKGLFSKDLHAFEYMGKVN